MSTTTGGLALRRRPKTSTKRPDDSGRSEDKIVQQVISIPIEKLHRHPSNRTIAAESVADLVQSLGDHGQREPIRVRQHPEIVGHYEIISGERRFVAAGQVRGIDSLQAIVETMTDSNSIIELAVANAARQDLNPIERAQLLQQLIRPVADGGAGMDRDAAGRVFGLNSESGVKNTLRLLRLPEFFQNQLASGQMSIAAVRPLCAYPDVFLANFAEWIQAKPQKYKLENFQRGDEYDRDDAINSFIRNDTRPVGDKTHTFYHSYQLGGAHPCLFDVASLSEGDRTALQICEIPDGKKGVRSVALNCKAWHKLQDPLVKAKAVSKSGPKDRGSKTSGQAPTAAELKAKRKKQDDQLASYSRQWICLALRCTLANRTAPDRMLTALPWMLHAMLMGGNVFRELYCWATAELCGPASKSKSQRLINDTAVESIALHKVSSADWWQAVWRVALWPVATRNDTDVGLATVGTIPDRLPYIDPGALGSLAAALGVSMETVWQHAAQDGWERSLVLRWLQYHTKDQLSTLAKLLKVTLHSDKRNDMAAELLQHHTAGKPLPLPSALSTPKVKGGAR